ncbi:KAP family P-loop NTPase fold protein [Ignatzschineria cameli]|uniref:KAP family P-loop NTPase fold protein n=1 Tax=Ignatzschineria cameli TaxID=2182793 RepID=UPI0013009AED|nr:P-loop NTPase fold protein [Ignatzschineria cameli]
MSKDLSIYQFDGENARDEFNRQPIAKKIIDLLTSEIDLSPMIIDGDWGTGKSEFCHKLINKFKAEHDQSQLLYIDAFQADHADNPLMTIIAEIMTLIPEKSAKTSFLKKALPVIRYGTKAILKAGVGHVLRENAENIAEGLEESIQDAANTAIDATVTAILKDHEEAEKNLKALQILLAELAEDEPIIIFIDELDRCRPDFSVHMLEVIKHTFDVKNVKFVLITNTIQLRASINHAYGKTIDAARYLDKFIKFTIQLPEKVVGFSYEPKLASVEYFNQLVAQSSNLNSTELKSDNNGVVLFTHRLIESKNLSLREVETFVRHLEVANILGIGLCEGTIWGYILLNIIGVFTDCFEPKLVRDIYQNNVDAFDLFGLIGIDGSSEVEIDGITGVIILLASEAAHNSADFKDKVQAYDEDMKYNSLEQQLFEWRYRGSSYFNTIKKAIDTMHFRN